jgi:hypothetical protein
MSSKRLTRFLVESPAEERVVVPGDDGTLKTSSDAGYVLGTLNYSFFGRGFAAKGNSTG